MPFPNPDTMIGGPRGPHPGGHHGRPKVSKRTLLKQRQIRERLEVLNAKELPFDGDARALCQAIYQDPTQPMQFRLYAARTAMQFERAPYQPKPEDPRQVRIDLDRLSDAQREQLGELMKLATGEPLLIEAPMPAPAIEQSEREPDPGTERMRAELRALRRIEELRAKLAER